jgi:hypothetical protein
MTQTKFFALRALEIETKKGTHVTWQLHRHFLNKILRRVSKFVGPNMVVQGQPFLPSEIQLQMCSMTL